MSRLGMLARLQRLSELERRRDLAAACAEADRCDASARQQAQDCARAEHEHAAAHAEARLCLSRMAIAASVVTASEDALRCVRTAQATARLAEDATSGAWLQTRFRAEWFGERERDERRLADGRRADRADAEGRLLRVLPEREA